MFRSLTREDIAVQKYVLELISQTIIPFLAGVLAVIIGGKILLSKKYLARYLNKKEDFNISNNELTKYFDLTASISEQTIVFPGDPTYTSEDVCSLTTGSQYGLCQMHLGNHTGTHVDFPAHVLKGGKTSSDYTIDRLIGSCLIIQVPNEDKSISKAFITRQNIIRNDFVFFKTSNSNLPKQGGFTERYVFIEPEAAEELLKKNVRVVGIDYISVDRYESESLPVHKTLLSNDILIVEGLELNNVPLGRCKVYIMPINIQNMDGLPARVVAKF